MIEKPGVKEAPNDNVQSMHSASRIADVAGRPINAPAKPISIIGSGVFIRGEVASEEEILIEGTIEGTITHRSQHVVVGRSGHVKALIHANSVRVEGRVDGDIHGDELVELTDSAAVNGNIFCARIVVADGARLNGAVQTAMR